MAIYKPVFFQNTRGQKFEYPNMREVIYDRSSIIKIEDYR